MSTDNRRRNIQIILTIIIMATIPFYCIGFVLFAFAPQNSSSAPLATNTPANTLPTSSGAVTATFTTEPGQPGVTEFPTDSAFTQVVPTNSLPPTLRALSPTPLIPTATLFIPPTLQPIPSTNTPLPPPPATATTLPFFPTDTDTPEPF